MVGNALFTKVGKLIRQPAKAEVVNVYFDDGIPAIFIY